jgi:uncharacterized membrane protein YccF (DUF307 family)
LGEGNFFWRLVQNPFWLFFGGFVTKLFFLKNGGGV